MGNDLEIEIRPGSVSGTYEVSVDSPAGSAQGTMQLDAAGLLGRRRELAASVLASAVPSRAAFSTLEAPVRDVGQALFEALFKGPVYGRYTASLQEAAGRGKPLRIVLRLRAPELAGIPWETLFDPESGEYLCQREPVVRYVDTAQSSSPLTTDGPLRILGMVAAPRDLAGLDTTEERRRLDDALEELAGHGQVEMVWVEGGNWAALQSKLTAGPWHVLHLIGHGGVGADGGVLALEDEKTGDSALVSAGRFARLLHACRPVPRLVVLNACSSGESSAEDLLSSTAASLVHSGISAAVAMQFAVTDPAALAFARGFYQALAQNIAVDEAVRLGRIAIDGTSEQTLEWVTPVLYLRTENTRLFDLTAVSRATTNEVSGAEMDPTYGEAAKRLELKVHAEDAPGLRSVADRTPADRPLAEGPPAERPPEPAVDERSRRLSPLLIGAGVAVTVGALVLVAILLRGGDGSVPVGQRPGAELSTRSGQASGDPTTAQDPGTEVSCWDGSAAAAAAACPLPQGLAGMASVFASLKGDCADGNADGGTMMTTKLELFECDRGSYTIRYTQWVDGFDHVGYIDGHSHGASRSRWRIDGEVSGFTWTGGIDDDAKETRKFRWQSSYRDYPYDVLVKGVDEAAMEEGVASVLAKPQSKIGLP